MAAYAEIHDPRKIDPFETDTREVRLVRQKGGENTQDMFEVLVSYRMRESE